jgi:hypothetical protein
MSFEKRIHALEEAANNNVPGTNLTRVLTGDGSKWALSIGGMQLPKHHFYGDSISDVVIQAEMFFQIKGK